MECQARQSELDDRQRRIIEGFNDEDRLPESMVQVATRNLRATSIEQGMVAKAKERLASHARDEGRKLKQVLRKVQAAAGRAFRDEEQRILETEIEQSVTRSAGKM